MKNPKYKIINICQSLPIIIVILFGFISIVATGGGDGTGVILTNENHDIEPFIEYAEASGCSEIRNNLFIINKIFIFDDEQLVLWDRAGDCPDGSYEVQLYKEDLDDLLCETYDYIAGPQRDMCEIIFDNIGDDNLGLDDSYFVEEITVQGHRN